MPGYPGKHGAHDIPYLKLGFSTPTLPSLAPPQGEWWLSQSPDLEKTVHGEWARWPGPKGKYGCFGFSREDAEDSSQTWSQAFTANDTGRVNYILQQSPWRQGDQLGAL